MTLEIPTEIETDLRAEATARGVDVETLALWRLRSSTNPFAAFDALADETTPRERAGFGPLPDEGLSRAAFYDDEEAA